MIRCCSRLWTAPTPPISGLYATGNNVSGMSVAAYVNIEGTGLGFALTSGRLAGANAAAASKSFRPLPKVVRFKA